MFGDFGGSRGRGPGRPKTPPHELANSIRSPSPLPSPYVPTNSRGYCHAHGASAGAAAVAPRMLRQHPRCGRRGGRCGPADVAAAPAVRPPVRPLWPRARCGRCGPAAPTRRLWPRLDKLQGFPIEFLRGSFFSPRLRLSSLAIRALLLHFLLHTACRTVRRTGLRSTFTGRR